MSAKTSPEMLKARKMIEAGATAYRAAKDCDLTVSGITRSKWYREFEAKKAAAPATRSAMDRAREMVTIDGKTAYEAAKLTGVAQSSISRATWYREHIKPGGKHAKNS